MNLQLGRWDAVAGGTLNNKTTEHDQEMIEQMATNNYQWQPIRSKPSKHACIYEVYAVTSLTAHVKDLTKKNNGITVHQQATQVSQFGEGDGNQEV